ncbi:hypothetical protein ACFL4T_04415 [candidate division KSB1 bacterium]
MLKNTIQILLLIVFLFNFCQKDWGTQRTELYTSLEGPPYSEFFNPEFFDVNFDLDPNALKIGGSINISANVSRNDNRNINVELFYRWYVNDSLVPYHSLILGTIYYNISFLFLPTLNGEETEEGFGINEVALKTSTYRAVRIFREENAISGVVYNLGHISVSLNLGYKDIDGIVKYFCNKNVNIPVYY